MGSVSITHFFQISNISNTFLTSVSSAHSLHSRTYNSSIYCGELTVINKNNPELLVYEIIYLHPLTQIILPLIKLGMLEKNPNNNAGYFLHF